MAYHDSKHHDPLAMGMAYQGIIRYLMKKVYNRDITFYQNKEQQYNIGESVEGVEVKYDSYCTRTRRLSIEVGEKSRISVPVFTPRGIMRVDNATSYIQGNLTRAWIFDKQKLRKYYSKMKPSLIAYDPPTIKKFYLYLGEADKIAESTLRVSPFLCEYIFKDEVPKWGNCIPCPLFKNGHCFSEGARLYKEAENAGLLL